MAEPVTKLEDLPIAQRRVIEANAGNELIPVKRDASGAITEYRKMSPQEYLTSLGGVTKAGYYGKDIAEGRAMSDEQYFGLLKSGGVKAVNKFGEDRAREQETQNLIARYTSQGLSAEDAAIKAAEFFANADKKLLETSLSSTLSAANDGSNASLKALQDQIALLTKQLTTNTAADKAAADAAKYNERISIYSSMADRFNKYGLTGLANKIKELAIAGATEATITLQLQETPEYQQRFAANADRLKKGLAVLTPAEYVNVEDSYRQVLRAYGLNQFDNDAYVRQFIANDMSPTELSNRVVTAVQRVQNADPAITNQLKQYYGIGTSDMVAYVLDPQQQFQKIERQIAASEIGVAAGRQGLTAGVSVAEQLAAQGVSQAEAQKGYATIADILPTAEKLSDIYGTTLDEYRQAEGEQEVFNSLASAQRKRQKLTAREIAAFSGSSGTNKTSLTTSAVGQY